MGEQRSEYIKFAGLNAPLHVIAPDEIRPLLDPILAAWPTTSGDGDAGHQSPFATLEPAPNKRWSLRAPLASNPDALHNPVNAICDLVVEMSWERLRSQPDLLCLHAAAVKFGDSLVIFPNARRAGKSVLSATLANLGHAVFSDDFVPLRINPLSREISGLANGIAPRLRLPLPENISSFLRQWLTDRIGPSNKQYGYLTGVDLPASGVTAPVGAVVVLERDAALTGPASLETITQDEAMASLVTQNFGRQVHSGAILQVTDALTRSVPVLKLRYNGVEEAAHLLNDSRALRDLPSAQLPDTDAAGPLPLAPLGRGHVASVDAIDMACVYRKLPDFTEVETETGLYLADGEGISIHRLNPVSAVIWRLIDAQVTGSEMAEVLQDLYPEIAITQLRNDTCHALQFLAERRFIVPDNSHAG